MSPPDSDPDDDDETIPGVARRPWGTSSEPTYRANGEPEEKAILLDAEQGPTKEPNRAAPSAAAVAAAPEVPRGGPQRRLRDAEVLQLAEDIRARAGASHDRDPRVLAVRLGFDVVPSCPASGEKSTATEVVFEWARDRRERGIRIYCALVKSFFLARRIEHDFGDVWALAIELALPLKERWNGRMMLALTQKFCPESVISTYVP